ncbi:MAG: hypothetical protein V4864_23830 [Pseudomonadota bacterium]
MPASSPLPDRLAAKLERQPNGCLLWTGAADKWGYGRIWSGPPDNKLLAPHRVSLRLSGVEVPDDELVLHGPCDNPACCEPEHLRVGSHADNMADRRARGRHAAKLTQQLVDRLREDAAAPIRLSYADLGVLYGISAGHARRIVLGQRWA